MQLLPDRHVFLLARPDTAIGAPNWHTKNTGSSWAIKWEAAMTA
jgi:hypothetical protein